ncbi:hypothetical protein BJY24_000103 [Nocardia transvalensis]|uniref:Uncharacterized protein n=1 Tax=Nocardia transvalensis TaxID=37333 RepID=A0A7W9UFP9_9NOCA|nr:hypothetical protein [Nocardia transvalensis]MBB5911236.1 hypothetical protein [Nocardia transvalensis]
MLLPHFDKLHQQRYVFNPASAAEIPVLDRLAERDGVDELITLMDRTRADLASEVATRDQVQGTADCSCHQSKRTLTTEIWAKLHQSDTLEPWSTVHRHHRGPALGIVHRRRARGRRRRSGRSSGRGRAELSLGAQTDTELLERVFGSAGYAKATTLAELSPGMDELFLTCLREHSAPNRAGG